MADGRRIVLFVISGQGIGGIYHLEGARAGAAGGGIGNRGTGTSRGIRPGFALQVPIVFAASHTDSRHAGYVYTLHVRRRRRATM
jgi:hypothetical protein